MAYIASTSVITPAILTQENTIIRKIQILNTGSLQIQNNGGAVRIVSPQLSSVQGMVIVSGETQILGR